MGKELKPLSFDEFASNVRAIFDNMARKGGPVLIEREGRTVVAEVLTVDDEIAEMIYERRSAGAIKQRAVEKGFSPMLVDALKKVMAGVTDLKEVEKVIGAI